MISDTVLHGVESRAKMLSRRYTFLEKEDLIQDGVETILRIQRAHAGIVDDNFLLKSVNNFFSNVEDRAGRTQKLFVNNIEMGTLDHYHHDIENEMIQRIDEDRFRNKSLKEKSAKTQMIYSLVSSGKDIKETARRLGMSETGVRKQIKKMKG